MRKPKDEIWYMSENKPKKGIIYYVESYIDLEEDPSTNLSGHHKLSDNIKTTYYIIDNVKYDGISATFLKEKSVCLDESLVFDTKEELVKSLLDDNE